MTVETRSGMFAVYNISAPTVVKTTGGRLVQVSIITPGASAGNAYDTNSTGSVGASNLIHSIPTSITASSPILFLDWPCKTGITIVPGTGQVLAVSFT